MSVRLAARPSCITCTQQDTDIWGLFSAERDQNMADGRADEPRGKKGTRPRTGAEDHDNVKKLLQRMQRTKCLCSASAVSSAESPAERVKMHKKPIKIIKCV